MTAEEIEKAIEQLAPRELARFREWFAHFEADRFDAAIARDAEAGRLDALADEALADYRAGRTRDLRATRRLAGFWQAYDGLPPTVRN